MAETRSSNVSSIEARGSSLEARVCQLTFERYCMVQLGPFCSYKNSRLHFVAEILTDQLMVENLIMFLLVGFSHMIYR